MNETKNQNETADATPEVAIKRTYGVREGVHRSRGRGFYPVLDGSMVTGCFYKVRENALQSAKQMATELANMIRRNGHKVELEVA
jgi:hypothetical protein